MARAAWLALALSFHAPASADAEARVTVVETYPAGDSITLGLHQKLYVRLSYTSERPVRIWAQPYLRGREVDAASNPSNLHTGTGEALGWFFLTDAGAEVDELRVTAGDGTNAGTHEAARVPLRVVAGSARAGSSQPPGWVTELERQSELASQQQRAEAADRADSASGGALVGGFILAMLGLSLFGFAAPVWGMWRWRGGWRLAASAPAIMMGLVLLNIVIGVSLQPTSHNLWPFELILAGLLSVIVTAALFAARRFTSLGR